MVVEIPRLENICEVGCLGLLMVRFFIVDNFPFIVQFEEFRRKMRNTPELCCGS